MCAIFCKFVRAGVKMSTYNAKGGTLSLYDLHKARNLIQDVENCAPCVICKGRGSVKS